MRWMKILDKNRRWKKTLKRNQQHVRVAWDKLKNDIKFTRFPEARESEFNKKVNS